MLLGSEHEPAQVHSSLELNLDHPRHHQPLGKPNEGMYPLVRGAFLSSCLDWGYEWRRCRGVRWGLS